MLNSLIDRVAASRFSLYLAWIIILFAITLNSLAAVTNVFTDHRLALTFMLRSGFSLYRDPNTGPLMSTLYPPLSILAYAPSTLFQGVRTSFAVAGVLVQIFVLAPALLLFAKSGKTAPKTALALALFVLLCNFTPVLETGQLVHADAPALFFCGLAVFATVQYFATDRVRWVVAAAALASLAPWAKQPAVPILIVPALSMVFARKIRPLAVYIFATLLFETGLTAAATAYFGFDKLWLWLIAIPSRHPWTSPWSTALPSSNHELLVETAPALVILFTVLIAGRRRISECITRPWAISCLAGVMLWPTSVLGHVKLGGALNSLLYSTYFLDIAVLALLVENLGAERPAWIRTATANALIVLLIPFSIIVAKTVAVPRRAWTSRNVEAYDYSRKHPGEVYFPMHPLSVYLAEHQWYNSDLGIFDRVSAGISVDQANYQRYLPPAMRFVAYAGTVPGVSFPLLPGFNRKVRLPELSGWTVFEREDSGSKER